MGSPSRITENTSLLHCNNRRKGDIVGEDYTCVDDFFSKLIDDILVNVLSRLSLKEAVRTSVLSSRWRYLWKGFTGCLNFDESHKIAEYMCKSNLASEQIDIDVVRHRFVSWVNQVLRSLQGHIMEELRICFDVTSNGDIHNWIKFAVEKKVRRLELDFNRFPGYQWKFGQFPFPLYFNNYPSFSSLTDLSLTNVALTGEVLEHLLSDCPLLERLSVAHSNCISSLKVSGSSLKLRYLELNYVENLEIHSLKLSYLNLGYVKNIEIHAPNLISFEFNGPEKPISIGNVPNLAEVSFGGYFCSYIMKNLFGFSCFLVQLHTLKLSLVVVQWTQRQVLRWPSIYYIPELYNLKHLEMEIDLLDDDSLLPCVPFLNASTSLYKFTLKLYDVKPSVESAQSDIYSRLSELISIRELELVGFVGCDAVTEFVIYLIENADLLEKVTIDPCKPWSLGKPTETFFRQHKDYQSNRRQAIQLAARLPLWEFVIR